MKRMRQAASIFGCFTLFMVASGQIWQDKTSRKNAQGNELYQKKDYTAALEKYIQAQDGKSHQQELSYNVANTLYRQKKYPEAAKELERSALAGNTGLNQKIYFNRGNSFYQMGQYPQAVESYEKALELDPKDRDAKYNLELALKKLQQSPQKKENSSNKDQKKQDSSKENQQPQNQQSDQQKSANPREQESKGDSQKQNAKPKESDPPQNQPQKGEQQGMDPKEALRILDAINSQEKKEQRKQVLKIQRSHVSGKDW